MLTTNVSEFLRKAHGDASLAEHVRSADSYLALADLSDRAGIPVTHGELRTAFTARNAGVLVAQMIRAGMIDQAPLAAAPAMDEKLGVESPRWT